MDQFVPSSFIPAQVQKSWKEQRCRYLKKFITFSIMDLSQFYIELYFECCGTKLTEDNALLLSTYRFASGDINNFL